MPFSLNSVILILYKVKIVLILIFYIEIGKLLLGLDFKWLALEVLNLL